ncbi:MAG: secretin N-terminal domain-containing protein [Candidatus Omnitrophota bacterium]
MTEYRKQKLNILIIYFALALCGSVCRADENKEYAALPVPAANGMISNLAITKERISLELRDIDIKDALKYLASKAEINIVPTNQVSGRITLMIKDAPIDDVFEMVIRSNGLAYDKIGSIYNVMTETEYKERYGQAFDDRRHLEVFHLKYVIPEQAYSIIDSIKSTIGKVLIENDSGTILVLDTPEKLEEIRKTIKSLERKGTVRMFDLKYANAEDVAKQLKSQLDKKKVGSIRADQRTNQVIVQTLPERMDNIAKLIEGLDQKTKEVLIQARIIQIKLTDNLSEGVEWEGLFELSKGSNSTTYLGSTPVAAVGSPVDTWRSRQQVLADTGYVGSYPFSGTSTDYASGQSSVGTEQMHVGVVGESDYDVLIKYLKTLGHVQILSNPKLAVTNNQQARVHVGERQAYITTVTTAGQTTTTVSEEVTFLDVGLQLFITPTINDQGYVTLNIKPEISSVVGTLLTAQNNKIPIIDTSTAETTVMVKDGATVVVGGLRREEETSSSRRMPILGSIPFLGNLFKTEDRGKSRNELLIMVTAHIIEGDELITGDDRDFGSKSHEKYQEYNLMTNESDLTEYEKEQKKTLEQKMYQEYPEYKEDKEFYPDLKPLK